MCYYLRVNNRHSRGISLGGTLLAVAILAALAATLASLCVTHLRTSRRAESTLHASNLARSAIAAGVAKVLDQQDYGVAQLPDETVTIETPHGTAFLSFNPDRADDQDMMYSTNNAANSMSATGGQGRVVPANSIHLVARGYSGDVIRQVETVISVPTFPWALAADGEIIIRDGAVVGSLPEGVWPPNMADLEPADLVSNSTSDSAIVLGSGSRILGDIETPGKVVLTDSTVRVEGQVRESADPSRLPKMDVTEFDPQAQGIAFDDITGLSSLTQTAASNSNGAASSGTALTGAARHEGALQLNQDIELSGAMLFVNGDLTVNGNIEGTGVLVVNGDLNVTSGVSLDGATKVAIVSSGKVSLRGVGPASSSIRGLFYTEGGLKAEEITVVGSLIAAGPDASVELVNARALSQTITTTTSGTANTTGVGVGGTASTTGGGGGAGGQTNFMAAMMLLTRDGGNGGGGGTGNGTGGNAGPGPTTTTTTTTTTQGGGTSDSSSFLPLKERVRVVSWFES